MATAPPSEKELNENQQKQKRSRTSMKQSVYLSFKTIYELFQKFYSEKPI